MDEALKWKLYAEVNFPRHKPLDLNRCILPLQIVQTYSSSSWMSWCMTSLLRPRSTSGASTIIACSMRRDYRAMSCLRQSSLLWRSYCRLFCLALFCWSYCSESTCWEAWWTAWLWFSCSADVIVSLSRGTLDSSSRVRRGNYCWFLLLVDSIVVVETV